MIEPESIADSTLARTKKLLRQHDLHAKKGLGQHFLVNSTILKDILEAASLSCSDIVFEIGPGMGVLTRELARDSGWVIAVELDTRLAEILLDTLFDIPNVSIIRQDVLETDPLELIRQEQPKFPYTIRDSSKYKIVANLPYYITAPIIRHFCEAKLKPAIMVLMVQKEVARNIVSQPGDMSILAVAVQFYGKPQIVKYVPAGNFYPVPKVDSAIIKIDMYSQPVVSVSSEGHFFEIVRAGFCAARKQIGNSLCQGLDITKAEALSLLKMADISSERRAENLSIEEWGRLERAFAGTGK